MAVVPPESSQRTREEDPSPLRLCEHLRTFHRTRSRPSRHLVPAHTSSRPSRRRCPARSQRPRWSPERGGAEAARARPDGAHQLHSEGQQLVTARPAPAVPLLCCCCRPASPPGPQLRAERVVLCSKSVCAGSACLGVKVISISRWLQDTPPAPPAVGSGHLGSQQSK